MYPSCDYCGKESYQHLCIEDGSDPIVGGKVFCFPQPYATSTYTSNHGLYMHESPCMRLYIKEELEKQLRTSKIDERFELMEL